MAKIDGKQIKSATVPNSALVTPAGTPTKSDKSKKPGNTAGNNSDTGLAISATPSGGGVVQVLVNGLNQVLGDGAKTSDCYFSGDGGATPRAINAIVGGDRFFWNGAIAGFELAATDVVDFFYNV